jgi:hypothetical protein
MVVVVVVVLLFLISRRPGIVTVVVSRPVLGTSFAPSDFVLGSIVSV